MRYLREKEIVCKIRRQSEVANSEPGSTYRLYNGASTLHRIARVEYTRSYEHYTHARHREKGRSIR